MHNYHAPSSDLDFPLTPDYAALEAADRAAVDAWLNRFPWLTYRERSLHVLADHPEFPGAYAEKADYDAFAIRLRRESERRVSCLFDVGWGRIRGAFDLVSGAAYLLDDGHYILAEELPETVDIMFADEPRAVLQQVRLVEGFANVVPVDSARNTAGVTLGEILRKKAQPVSAASLGHVVELLDKANKLPPVTQSVNGKRFAINK